MTYLPSKFCGMIIKNFHKCTVILLLLQFLSVGHAVISNFDDDNHGIRTRVNITQSFHPCLRDCDEDVKPQTCYYKFHLEHYTSNNDACTLCKPNATTQLSGDCQCILGDGVERYIKVINRILPGPSIQVCQNDKVIIDVINLLDGEDAAIHWHGIFQAGSQYYDGVPFVTQCPIASGTTFRYEWTAQRPGTNFWHSHTGLQEMDGVYGSLIIRTPSDPQKNLYDMDREDHVIVVSDWMHEGATEHYPGKLVNATGQAPRTFLFNGKGWNYGINPRRSREAVTIFDVEPNLRYRFRFINACGSACPSRLTFQGHRMTVIATDGNSIKPVTVDAIDAFSGERYDFVLEAYETPLSYWIELTGLGECNEMGVHQVAVLRYGENQNFLTEEKPLPRDLWSDEIVLNPFDRFDEATNQKFIGITELENLEAPDTTVVGRNVRVNHKIYLSFKFANIPDEELFKAYTYNKFLVGPDGRKVRSLINNISSIFPPSPYISQYNDNPPDQFCSYDDGVGDDGSMRTCSHVITIDLNAVVELIIVDEIQVLDVWHPFHLHGTDFYVLGMNRLEGDPDIKMTRNRIIEADNKGMLRRDFGRSPRKDTLAVPKNGYIIVRFRATNPGFWLLHCHFQYHMIIGMHLVLNIGNMDDLPPPPKNFPKCGDYR